MLIRSSHQPSQSQQQQPASKVENHRFGRVMTMAIFVLCIVLIGLIFVHNEQLHLGIHLRRHTISTIVNPNLKFVSILCDSPFGNPCGPFHTCRTMRDADNMEKSVCEPDPTTEECNVICYDNHSTCVRDITTRKFQCRCNFGYQKPDQYFDRCDVIPGYDEKQKPKPQQLLQQLSNGNVAASQ